MQSLSIEEFEFHNVATIFFFFPLPERVAGGARSTTRKNTKNCVAIVISRFEIPDLRDYRASSSGRDNWPRRKLGRSVRVFFKVSRKP